jgi:thymus-specific serine protease
MVIATTDYRNQKYFLNDRYYKPGGPAFLELTGEWSLTSFGIESSLANELAKRFNGMHIGLEHRYYGDGTSIPVPDFENQNLKWLNADQALADAANFIKAQNANLDPKTKWIMVGGSYAGNLAAWMRPTYPELVFAAYPSSAPVNALIDYWQYDYATDLYLWLSAAALLNWAGRNVLMAGLGA